MSLCLQEAAGPVAEQAVAAGCSFFAAQRGLCGSRASARLAVCREHENDMSLCLQ